ncbi:hypothetical protein C8F04DRAFT_1279202 [Mycena alexandri]|uniref:DNA-directed RNA polymerase n=1 Tax=Mycena alexandri TaxID=1745969 RepID=A0AAD6RY02_9AGAR|nr:hypothetical protein C8F04DRAFT_1279202 [Mycena alexandri]
MTDSDLNLLGLSDEYGHPESMILTVMPVSPPPVRPSITVDGGVNAQRGRFDRQARIQMPLHTDRVRKESILCMQSSSSTSSRAPLRPRTHRPSAASASMLALAASPTSPYANTNTYNAHTEPSEPSYGIRQFLVLNIPVSEVSSI